MGVTFFKGTKADLTRLHNVSLPRKDIGVNESGPRARRELLLRLVFRHRAFSLQDQSGAAQLERYAEFCLGLIS